MQIKWYDTWRAGNIMSDVQSLLRNGKLLYDRSVSRGSSTPMPSTMTCHTDEAPLEAPTHWCQPNKPAPATNTSSGLSSLSPPLRISIVCLCVFWVLCPGASLCHLGGGTGSLMTSISRWCPLSQLFYLVSTTTPFQISRLHKSPPGKEMHALFGCTILQGNIDTPCRDVWVPSNLIFFFFSVIMAGFMGDPRWPGQLDFSTAFYCPRTLVLHQIQLSWSTSTRLPHSVVP